MMSARPFSQLLVMLLTFAVCIPSAFAQARTMRLPSGKQVKILAMGPMFFAGGKRAAMVKYETPLKLSDKIALSDEVDDLWQLFQSDIGRAGESAAVISAQEKTASTSPMQMTHAFNFVFKKDAKGWSSTQLTVSPARAAFKQGLDFARQNKYKEALSAFNKSISLDPNYAPAYNSRSACYMMQQDYNKALSDQNKAIALNPDSELAYMNRGATYLGLKQYDKGIEDSTKAISLTRNAPPSSTAGMYANRGEGYYFKGEYQRALDDLSQAIRADGSSGEAYFYRGEAYEKIGKPDLAKQDKLKAAKLGYKEGSNSVTVTK